MTTTIFLHGLESSGRGTKGTYLSNRFPEILCPDFSGSLFDRLKQLSDLCKDKNDLTFIGSSYGGLMATCFAIANPNKVSRIILLAPALNFEEYKPPKQSLDVPTLLVMGKEDDVCPPDIVQPKAEKTFTNLEIMIADDDHMLHNTFQYLPWNDLIG